MILVTGATGLLGSHLLFELVVNGQNVKALKRYSSNIENVIKTFSFYNKNYNDFANKIEWVDGDITDIYSVLEAMQNVAVVYHCAANVSFEKNQKSEIEKVNIEGTANVVNAALEKKISKLCHVSSIATIGDENAASLLTEECYIQSFENKTNYAVSKYAAEREVWRASNEGLNVIVVNPSIILGPGNWNKSSTSIFSKCYNGIKFYTLGTTGFIDARDVASLMIKLINSNTINERFILNAENYAFKQIFELIHIAFNKPIPSIKAGRFLSELAWRMDSLKQILTGSKALITKETAQSAHKKLQFSNAKIKSIFPNYKFIPIESSIKEICEIYLKDARK